MSNKIAGVLGSLSVYVDTQSEPSPTLKYKAKPSGIDAGAFYCPYVPLFVGGGPTYENIEDASAEGVWKFLLRRRSESELPHCFADQLVLDAYEWIRANVARVHYEITYVKPDDFAPAQYKTRYGYLDASSAPPHHHMVVQFFVQKDAALFKLLHL